MGIPKNGIPQRYTKIIIGIPNYGYTKKKTQNLWLYGIPGIPIIWLYCFTLRETPVPTVGAVNADFRENLLFR